MTHFITLNLLPDCMWGGPIIIRANAIVSLCIYKPDRDVNPLGTRISTAEHEAFLVQESPAQIIALIDATAKFPPLVKQDDET